MSGSRPTEPFAWSRADRPTHVFDPRTGRVVAELWPGESCAEFAFSPDGRILAARLTSYLTLGLARWQGDTFVEAESWTCEDDSWGLEFSPCSRYLIAGTPIGFEIIEVETGEVEFAYKPFVV